MTIATLLCELKEKLKAKGIESYRIDSELIVMNATGCTRVQLITKEDMPLSEEQLAVAYNMLKRRMSFEPMQYILGSCEFMDMNFQLNADTLIPRGDTECLVERVLEHINRTGAKTVLDIGTGSGAIIVSLAALGEIEGVAVDISQNALDMAENNAKINSVANKITFIKSDLFENVKGKFDIIVSNPPYIETDVIKTLESQVKDFEPVRALDGGIDGLDFYRAIVEKAPHFLNPKGYIAFEIGYNQGESVKALLENKGFINVTVGKDLAGLDRTVAGQLK